MIPNASTNADAAAPGVLTIGHSNVSIEAFLDLLRPHGVEALVDARSQPYSKFTPHFSRENLERAVRRAGMTYVFLGDALGGRPPADQCPACYDADGNALYERIEEQPFYRRGIDRLREWIGRARVCVMCGEEDPARCHRRLLVGRTLIAAGIDVRHVRGDGSIETEREVEERFLRENPKARQLGFSF